MGSAVSTVAAPHAGRESTPMTIIVEIVSASSKAPGTELR
jgi:hypothetical protein